MLELSGEVTSLKTELGSVGTDMKGVTDTITELTNKVLSAELGSKTTRSELTSLRSGLAGLTSSLLATKSQTDLIVQVTKKFLSQKLANFVFCLTFANIFYAKKLVTNGRLSS